MGRMFRIISENGQAPTFTPAAADVPFVEVGGPGGTVTSIAAPVVAPKPAPEPVAAEPSPEVRALSVAFHRFPKPGLKVLPGGVSADVVAYHFPDHPVSAEYRAVRDEIRRQFDEPGPRSVLFTAASPAAGTTTVALNIAVALAQDTSAKVLVVDADLHRASVARKLGVADVPGLAEVLGQTIPLAWALQPTAVGNLHVLTAGAATADTAAAMASAFPRLVDQLRQWFDWVLVDGGAWPVDGVSACDAAYLVTRQADIDRTEFTDLRASVAAAGGTVRGFVTTRP